MIYTAGKYWGRVKRGSVTEIRVDFTDTNSGLVKNETLQFTTDPTESEINNAINTRKQKLETALPEPDPKETVEVSKGTNTLIDSKENLKRTALGFVISNPTSTFTEYQAWCNTLPWQDNLVAQRIIFDYFQVLNDLGFISGTSTTQDAMYIEIRDYVIATPLADIERIFN